MAEPRPPLRLLLLACLASLTACASSEPVPDKPELHDFKIEGTKALDEKQIKARILTAEGSWLPWKDKQYFDESVFETDLKRIVRLYQAHGYYDAKIAERHVTPAGKDAVDVRVRVEEGPVTKVGDFAIEGLDELPADVRQRVTDKLPLAQGEVLVEEKYEALKRELTDRLEHEGYAEASVSGVVEVEAPKREASAIIQVDAGPRYTFSDVFVAGANKIPRQRLIDIARNSVPRGKTYNPDALDEAQAHIFDLGVFSAVKVTRGAPDRQEKTIPVVVSVREAPFRTVRAGAGLGIDPKRTELPRLTAEWTNRNFFGDLRRLTASTQVAFVFLPSIVEAYNDPERRGLAGTVTLDFEQPDLLRRRDLSLTSTLEYEHGKDQAFDFNSGKARLGFIWRINRALSLTPSYNLNVFKLLLHKDVDPRVAVAGQAGTENRESFIDPCSLSGQVCVLSYLEQRVLWDRRDSATDPRDGVYAVFALQEGSHLLFGDYDYLRVLPEVRGYLPLGQHVLALRGRVGLLFHAADQQSSVLTRFFLGGSSSQRGFGNRDLAPREQGLRTVYTVEDTKLLSPFSASYPIGGNGMLEVNAELRLNLPGALGLVLFADTGAVTPEVSDLGLGEVHVAAGPGLRYQTPFGPVRFDVAYRLNKLDVQPYPQKLRGVPLPNFHFSIGEAF